MNITETGALLAKIQAFDNRKVDEGTIRAWQEVLEPYAFQDCSKSVAKYYRGSSKWIMPSHVVDLVSEIERGRLIEIRGAVRLSDKDEDNIREGGPDAYRKAMARIHRLLANGTINPNDYNRYIEDNLEVASFEPMKAIAQ